MLKRLLVVIVAVLSMAAQSKEADGNMHTVKVFLPYSYNSGPERIFRVLEEYGLKRQIKFVPEFKPGGNGLIGPSVFLNEPANGNSILLTIISDIAAPSEIKKFKETDLYPVAGIGTVLPLVVARIDAPVNNLSDLKKVMREQPDRLSWGVVSEAYEKHIRYFARASGADPDLLVTTKFNTGKGMNTTMAVAGGHVDLAILASGVIDPMVRQGKVKVLGSVKSRLSKIYNKPLESFDTVFSKEYPSIDGFGVFVNSRDSESSKKYWEKFFQEFKKDPAVRERISDQEFIMYNSDKTEMEEILKFHRPAVKINTSGLTPRQVDVVNLIAKKGLDNLHIAQELGIGESAVKHHVGSVLKKYGLRDRTQLSVYFNTKEKVA